MNNRADFRHDFDPSILRAYDLRGVFGKTLHSADAHALGRGFAARLQEQGGRRVAVGYDGRLSSPALEEALCQGLADGGMTVVRIGRGPTPMLYFATHTLDVAGGVMVTGSHNPPDHNGFKLVLDKKPFFGDDIAALGARCAAGIAPAARGTVETQSIFEAYVTRLLADFRPGRDLRVAWDAGNGATGEVMAALAARLPGRHFLLNETIDGHFPVHHPDPTVPENLIQLQERVTAEGCDVGIAFDGDGDRLGVVDEDGEIIWGDQMMLYFAREILAEQPGATIIADIKASQVLCDGIAQAGGRPLMWKTGHSMIKHKMAVEKAPFAGEMSAHLFFADRYYGFDDGLYAALRLLNRLGEGPQSLGAFRQSLPETFATPELRFDCPDDRKEAVVARVKAQLLEEKADFLDIDGVRVTTAQGWWLLRPSNTQPVLVVRCEAGSAEALSALLGEVQRRLRSCGITPPQSLSQA